MRSPQFEEPRLFVARAADLPLSGPVLLELMQAVLARGVPFRFCARGWSMDPFIRDGDVITVSPLQTAPALGEVVAFIRPQTGTLAVHRVIARRGAAWLIQGDNVPGEADGWVAQENILGRVTRVERNGRLVRGGLGVEAKVIAWLQDRSALRPLQNIWFLFRRLCRLPRRIAAAVLRRGRAWPLRSQRGEAQQVQGGSVPVNSEQLELDGKKRRLVFRGSCLELLPLCAAACCREWRISLSSAEYASGLYAAEQTCALTDKACDKHTTSCIYRLYQLKKTADGACVHLDENNRCSIYENRPQVCRDFTCQGGWRLGSVFPAGDDAAPSGAKLEQEAFVARLTDEMTFVSHPLIKLHTVFYNKAKGEITFVKEMVGSCGKFYTRDSFQYPQLDDELILHLIRLFDSKDTLQDVYQRFCNRHAVGLTKKEFHDIVWLLNKHNIILSAMNFRGMLGGMGAI